MKKHICTLALGFLGLTTQVHAGQWSSSVVPTHTLIRNFWDGDTESAGGDVATGVSYINVGYANETVGWWDWSTMFGYPLEPNWMGDGTASRPYGVFFKGKLQLKYTPDVNEVTPIQVPVSANIKTTTILDVNAAFDLDRLYTKRILSVGLDPLDSSKKFVVPIEETTTYNGYYNVKDWKPAGTGKSLVAVKTAGGQWINGQYVVEYPVEMEFSQYTDAGYAPEVENNDSSFDVRVDNRSIVLSRGVGNKEKTVYENGVPVTYGDTTYSYLRKFWGTNSTHQNTQTINANYSGDWSTTPLNLAYNTTYSWLPDSTELPTGFSWNNSSMSVSQLRLSNNLIMPTGGLEDHSNPFSNTTQWTGQAVPKTELTIKYFARDNVDNAEAEARYKLRVHEPIESQGTPTKVAEGTVEAPLVVEVNGQKQWLRSDRNDDTTVREGSGAVSNGTATVKTEGRGIGAETGLSIGGSVELAHIVGISLERTYSVSGQLYWEEGHEVSDSEEITWPDLAPGEEAVLSVILNFSWYEQNFRKYDAEGEILVDANDPTKAYDFVWSQRDTANPRKFFKVYDAESPSPNPYNVPAIHTTPSNALS